MFQKTGFQGNPMGGPAFLPQVRLGGLRQPYLGQAFYGSVHLGQDTQTAQSWYERAKKAIDRYKFLKSRVETIDNRIERENIKTWLGAPNVPGTPEYRYTGVVSDFTSDVAREGVGAYNVERRQNRVAELEEYNDEFDQKIQAAIAVHGMRPVPVTTPPTPGVQPTAPPGPDLTLPIVAGAAAIALAVILS